MHFGDKLRQLRKEKEWTQPQLADAIGIEQSYLSKLENGKSIPSADIFQLILQEFDIDTGSMLADIDASIVHRQLRQIPEVANYLNQRSATDLKFRRRWLIGSALCTIIGLVLSASSYFGLLISESQYTYISKGVVLAGESKEIFDNYNRREFLTDREQNREREAAMTERLEEKYLLTPYYRGDIFNIPAEGGSRTFKLYGQREEPRIENRVIAVVGIFLALCGIFGFILEKKMTEKL